MLCGYRVSCFAFRVSCFAFRVSCFVFRVSRFVFRVSCFVFRVSCFIHRPFSQFVFHHPRFAFHASCFVFRPPPFAFRPAGPGPAPRMGPTTSAATGPWAASCCTCGGPGWRPRPPQMAALGRQLLHLWWPWMATPTAADGTTTGAATGPGASSCCTCGGRGWRPGPPQMGPPQVQQLAPGSPVAAPVEALDGDLTS